VPNYEYQCQACSHVYEREHAIGEKKRYKCPECGSGKSKKLISSVGLIFKGSGFYVTDNRGAKGKVKTAGNGNGASVKKDSKEKTETKSTEKKKSDSSKTDTMTPISEN